MFELNGEPVALDFLQGKAKEYNMDIDSYINKMESKGLKKIEPGKTTPPKEDNQGVPVEENATPNEKPTDSSLENGSLEYTKAEPFKEFEQKKSTITEEGQIELRQSGDGEFQPIELEEVVVTGKDKTEGYFKKLNKVNQQARLATLSTITKVPEIGVSIGAGIAATTTDILGGFFNLTDKYGVAPVNYAIGKALGYDTTLRAEVDASVDNFEVFEDVSNLLRQYTIKKYDKEGNEQDILSLIEQDNYSDAAELAFSEGFSAAPYLALSIASPIYGSALIGSSVTGQEVQRALKERPEATLTEIYGASVLKGGIEFATNAIGGGLQRGILGIGKKLGTGTNAYKKAVDIYTKTYLGKVAESGIGLTKGGLTNFIEEASASIGNAFVDAAVYNDPFERKSVIRQAINEGLVGLALGAPVGSLGAFNSIASKQQALEFLAPKQWNIDLSKQNKRLEEAKIDLNNAPANRKEKFQKRVQKIESLIKMKKQQLQNSFDNLTKKEKKQYANNLNKSAEAIAQIGNNKYTADTQETAKKDFNEANKQNEILVGKEIFDSETEKSISKTLKNTEQLDEAFKEAKQKVKNVKFEYISDVNAKFDARFDPNTNTVTINKPIAIASEQTNAIGHELLHYMIAQKFATDNVSMEPLVNSFKDYLKETQPELYQRVQERIDLNYTDEAGNIENGALEEYFNVFSDLISKEKIIVNESLSDKIKNTTTKFLNGLGFGSVKLETGKDVFNFIRNYQKNISEFKFKQLGVDLKSSKIPQAVDAEIQKSKKSISGDNIQKIFDEKGKDGTFEIIEAYKPLTTKLTNKYRNVPGFDFELLQSEIEIGKRGLLDLINAYDPSKGATLNTYVQGQLANRSIEAANRILDTEFKLDVTEAKGVTDTVTAEETIEREEATPSDEIKSLRKEIGLSEELVTKVKDAVVKTFGTKLPNPQDSKFRFELQKRFRTELKKPLSKFVGKQADYEAFLRENFESVYSKMPQSLINRRFKEFAEPVLDKNGKQVREKTAEGNKVYVKKKISKAEWIKYFIGADVKSSTKGARKTAIVEGMAEEIAFDATMEVLNDPDIVKKYKGIAEISGEKLPENFIAQISKQIDRGEDFKFSKSLLDEAKKEYNLSDQEIARLALENNVEFLQNTYPILYTLFNDASERQVKNASDAAEKENLEIFNRAEAIISDPNILNVVDDKIAGDDGSRVDHHAIIHGRKIGIETKKDYTARYGQLEIKFNVIKDDVVITSTLNSGEDFINIAELLNYHKPFKKALLDYAKKANIKKNRDKVSFELKEKLKKEKFQRKVSFKSNVNINAIKAHYINKTKDGFKGDYILIGEDIYHFGINPLNLNVPELKGNGQIEVRLKLSKDKDGKVAVRLIGEYRIPNVEKNNVRSIKNDKDFVALVKESNLKFSKSLSRQFNEDILQKTTKVDWAKRFSPVEARVVGKGKGKKFFIPYSADDFVGLLYATLGTKKQGGNEQMEWYKENLLRPFSRGIQQYEAAKQQALRDWQVLKKEAKKDVPGGLGRKNATGLTNQDAVRIYIWATQGMDIPGTEGSPELVQQNLEIVKNNEKLKAFADRLIALQPEGYPEPSNNWDSGDITTDIVSYINGVKRSEFLTEWKENADEIFSDQNKEKLRALYGDTYIEALDDILHRMRTGTNRKFGVSKIERQFMDWTNNSVGAIMFFNARSAVLQTLSAVNFINFSDNNPINAGIAFANQRQYWNDFSTLFNSDFLKQRRTGLQTDVNADEIARAAKTSTNKARAALSALLKFGFTPTQIADSFAIASGGATMYRNRINKYLKEGLEQKEAEQKAFTDFQEIAEETQQSARPDRISAQQASSLGRLILAFGNTPMQYARLTKKAALDLVNGRGDWKTNISKIAYYSVIQNIIFSALQQGLFALLFDDEEDDKEKSRLTRIANSSADTLLRGLGVYGAAAATVKNMILEIIEQSEKSRPDYTKIAIEATALSPPINSKLRKLESAGKTFTYKQSKEKVFTEGFSLENPGFLAGSKVISAATNLPADRIVQKMDHLKTAMEGETELWQSIALALGWSEWDLNMIEKQTKKPKVSYKKSKSRSRPKRKTRTR
jgi:hypothetical protein